MGRQLPIVATPNDEREMLRFIRTLSPIRVYIAFATTADAIWIDDWENQEIEGVVFHVWLESFAWVPEYKQTGGPRCPKDRAGHWYVANGSEAPVIEVSRTLPNSVSGGRVYWARDFSAPDGLAYDATGFAKAVDRIWNWIRRKGRRRETGGAKVGPYFLPDAWREFGRVSL